MSSFRVLPLAFRLVVFISVSSLSPATSISSETSSSSDISASSRLRNSKFAITAASESSIIASVTDDGFLAGVRRPCDSLARLFDSVPPFTFGLTFSSCSLLLFRPSSERTRFERMSMIVSV
uniref:Putative secreted protein n=2 Tax=Nyssorhynchus TaxID=44543 RepID=A0A2M4B1B5_9DIPT